MTRARELSRFTNENVFSVEANSFNVGLGSTSPDVKFDVQGSIEATGISTFHDNLFVGAGITMLASSGIVSAVAFHGDGSNLDNTGSTLSAASGSQRVVVTSLTSGTMTSNATDADLTFDAGTNTLNVGGGANISGVTTSGTAIVGSAATINATGVNVTGIVTTTELHVGVDTGFFTEDLVVNGDARVTGILTVGTESITFNGTDNSVTIGTGVTVFGNTGIVSATEFRGSGSNLTGVSTESGVLKSVQVYDTSGSHTWTKPTGLTRVRVYVTGGGGGGSLADNTGTNTACGGSGGGTSIKLIEDASLGSSETVTVGAGGAKRSSSNGNGSSGGTSSFGSHCSATGGDGGTTSYVSNGGLGSSGDINLRGGSGHYGWQDNRSGQGGSSYYGVYGRGAGNNQAGGDAAGYGGGGGGSTGAGGGSALNSGAGGVGVVVVEEYF